VCVRAFVRACVRACVLPLESWFSHGRFENWFSKCAMPFETRSSSVCVVACVRACVFPFENSRPLENSFSNGLGQCSTATAAPASRHYRGCTEV
jgi:hypothetical protein